MFTTIIIINLKIMNKLFSTLKAAVRLYQAFIIIYSRFTEALIYAKFPVECTKFMEGEKLIIFL